LEVRSGSGDLIWRADRDGKQGEQVVTPQVAADINMMMNKVVEEGTGKRAILDGIKAAGKTGTTNAYRDAWFVGYTGNYVSAVWFGNDDYSPTNRMTGGSLPAMAWKQIMTYAHRGIEVKPIPGVIPGPMPAAPPVAAVEPNADSASRPAALTRRSVEVLQRVERLMDSAFQRVQAASDAPGAPAGGGDSARTTSSGPIIAAGRSSSPPTVRGN